MIACDYPGCTARYRRKEHLTRHTRKHFPAAPSLTCEVCNKAFDRSDSLRRHRQLHLREQRGDIASRTLKACDRCHSSKTRCDGRVPCNVCSHRGVSCTFTRQAKRVVAGNRSRRPADQAESISDHPDTVDGGHEWGMASDTSGENPDGPRITGRGLLDQGPPFSDGEIQGLIVHHENQLRAKGLLVARAEPADGGPHEAGPSPELDIDQYVGVYFSHFHYQWPMLHPRSFRLAQEPRILLLAVVMIGLWVTGDSASQSRAESMHEKLLTLLENRMGNWRLEKEFTNKDWAMPTYQAVVLNLIFAMIREVRHDLHERCRLILHALTTTCMTGGLFSYDKMHALIEPTDPVLLSWTYLEEINRLALIIFKLNIHFGTGLLTVADLQFPLPDNGYLWDAPGSQEFYRRYHVQLESGTCENGQPFICDIVRDVQEGKKGSGLLIQADAWLGFVASHAERSLF